MQHMPHSWLPQTLVCHTSLVQDTSFTDSTTNRWRNGFWDDSGSCSELLRPLLMDAEDMPHSAWITALYEAGAGFRAGFDPCPHHRIACCPPPPHFTWRCIGLLIQVPQPARERTEEPVIPKKPQNNSAVTADAAHTSVVVKRHLSLLLLCKQWWDYLQTANTTQINQFLALCLHFNSSLFQSAGLLPVSLSIPRRQQRAQERGRDLSVQSNTIPLFRKLSIFMHRSTLKSADYNFEKNCPVTLLNLLFWIWVFLSCPN